MNYLKCQMQDFTLSQPLCCLRSALVKKKKNTVKENSMRLLVLYKSFQSPRF